MNKIIAKKISDTLNGHEVTLERRKKISESLKKYYKAGGKVNLGMLGKFHSKEWKEEARKRMLKNNPFKDKKHSKKSIERMKKNHIGMLGKIHSKETKEKMSEIHQGKKHSKETKEKLRQINLNKKLSEEHKKHISDGNMGRIVSDITKEKIRKKLLGHPGIKGKDNPSWRGGISKEPYSFDFTRELKELIRKRDNYTCQICGKIQIESMIPFPVHHIDYNKTNSNQNNLITLCRSCHPKTNHNRKYWIKYFEKFMPIPM